MFDPISETPPNADPLYFKDMSGFCATVVAVTSRTRVWHRIWNISYDGVARSRVVGTQRAFLRTYFATNAAIRHLDGPIWRSHRV